MTDDYVDFGNVARHQLGMQAQYARHYLLDAEIVGDARWTGDVGDWHFLRIHKDDVDSFVARALAWRRAKGIIR